MSRKSQKNPYYSETFKRKVVARIVSGELGISEAARTYGIGGSMTLYRWIAKYENASEMPKAQSKRETKSRAELEAELQGTKQLLEAERMRSEAYLAMIKLAEDRYQVPIEKKFGAKQSKK